MEKPASDSVSININKLSKQYSQADNFALRDLSLQVQAGEVYGFLGPNGAGKSTTIRLLMNFIQPTSGNATILGLDVVKDSVKIKQSVGYLSGDFAVYPKMTGKQFLAYMDEVQPAVSQAYIHELANRLKADLNKRLGELSRGNRQKIGIIQAFMHQPRVLILDEPTSGLDPLMQEVFYDLLREAKQRGACVFVSSHILSEVQKMCDRIGIIREGQLVSESNMNELANKAAQIFDITFTNKIPLAELKRIKGIRVVNSHNKTVTIRIHEKLSPLFAVLAKHEVINMDARNLDLEEVFLHFYKDKDTKR